MAGCYPADLLMVGHCVGSAAAMSIGLELHDLIVSYQRHPAVHHVSGRFLPGSLTAIVGPNGAGKSTLLKAVMGLVACSGRLEFTGTDVPRVAYLPQLAELDRGFPITVADVVALGCWEKTGVLGGITGEQRAQIDAALHAVGMQGFERRAIGTLSGGQFQRVLFARLAVQDADLILLDEPFAGVDSKTTTDLTAQIMQWHDAGKTIIAVLHDMDRVQQYFPDCLLLARKPVAWGSTTTVLSAEHLQQARCMAEAWDESAPVCLPEGSRS